MNKAEEAKLSDSDRIPLAYLHQCLNRNQKYIQSYLLHRLNKLRELRWQIGPIIPDLVNKEILSQKEQDYFVGYSNILADYNEDLGFDITGDTEVNMFKIYSFAILIFVISHQRTY